MKFKIAVTVTTKAGRGPVVIFLPDRMSLKVKDIKTFPHLHLFVWK